MTINKHNISKILSEYEEFLQLDDFVFDKEIIRLIKDSKQNKYDVNIQDCLWRYSSVE